PPRGPGPGLGTGDRGRALRPADRGRCARRPLAGERREPRRDRVLRAPGSAGPGGRRVRDLLRRPAAVDAGRALTPAASRTRHTGGMAVTEELRIRRPPPPFRVAEVVEVADRSPHLRRLVLAGPELVGFAEPEPAASIRWLPARGDALEIPEWNGNEFLYADGSRPPIRTLTPLEVDGT